MAISRRTERAMVRSMCGVKLVDRKNNEELMEMLGLEETLDKTAKVNGVLWYKHVIRRDDDNVLKKALMPEVNRKQNRERPKQIWRRQVEEIVDKIGLEVDEAANHTKWKEGVRVIVEGMVRCIRPLSTRAKIHRIETG